MKRFGFLTLLAVAGILMVTAHALAYNLEVNFANGTTYETTAFTGYATYGDMMDGMSVTAFFTDNTSETLIWQDTQNYGGGVLGSNWSLSLVGNTYGSDWTLSASKSISSLSIDAGTGNTVFDNTRYIEYTPGSSDGWTFEVTNPQTDLDITATYSNLIAMNGSAPQGDLYRTLTIAFNNQGGFGADSQLSFIADTDSFKFSGDIQQQQATSSDTPEPGTVILLGFGIAGLVGFRKKFRK